MECKIREFSGRLGLSARIFILLFILFVVNASSRPPSHLTWKIFPANMSEVFSLNFTEIKTPSAEVCVLHASRHPPANVACHASSRCVWASLDLLRPEWIQTEAFTCWTVQACLHEGTLFYENDDLNFTDPICYDTRPATCDRRGVIFKDVPPPRTTCTAPFMQHSFGCMHDNGDFSGTYCEARNYCEELGGKLASPHTAQDVADMKAYFDEHHDTKSYHFIGLFKKDGSWRWPYNHRDPGSVGTGDWARTQPNGIDDKELVAVMYPSGVKGYQIGDAAAIGKQNVLCQVWETY